MLALENRQAVAIVRFFDDLPDPRSEVNRRHRLGDVIVIAICAIVALADGPTSLDMTCREDESRVRQRNFAENLAWLRRLTLSLIKQHPSQDSQIMKRRMAGWSTDFLMQVLTGKTA